MKSRAVVLVACGQFSLLLFLVVCVALHPGFVLKANEGGLSNYGIHQKTAAAYTLALGAPTVLSFLAARLITSGDEASYRFRQLLNSYGWIVLLTLLSTYSYSLNTALRDLHIVIGSVLIVFETVASLWMYRLLGNDRWNLQLLGVQLLGFALAVLTIFGVLHVLFITQVLTCGAFAILLVRTAKLLPLVSTQP
jgi:hypothetical protein